MRSSTGSPQVADAMTMGARVRLLRDFGSVRAGSEGVVFGYYRRPGAPEVAVAFDDDPALI